MEMWFSKFTLISLMVLLSSLRGSAGIRFVIDREECFSHDVQYQRDTVHTSFIVIKAGSTWHYADEFRAVKGPSGDQIHDSREKTSEKFEFVAQKKGLHHFCFTKSPYHATVDFDIHVGSFAYFEHFNPLLEQITKLNEALYEIQFEQHWLVAQTDHLLIVNEGMSQWTIHRTVFESAALVGTSLPVTAPI